VLAVCTAVVAWSRVYLGYHSLDQVIAGITLGAVYGSLWVQLMSMPLTLRLFDYVCNSAVGQCLDLKNTYGPDLLRAETAAHTGSNVAAKSRRE